MAKATSKNFIGEPNPHPFMSIKHFVEGGDEWLPLVEKDPKLKITFMEKLDGSNMAVSSDGMACSRRVVLLDGPSVPQWGKKKAKFMGFELDFVLPYIEKVKKMYEDEIRTWFPNDEFVAVCYGELILQGTSSSKMDIFNYQVEGRDKHSNRQKKQKFGAGEIYSYSVSLHFKEVFGVDEFKDKVATLLGKGYNTFNAQKTSSAGSNSMIYLLMNDKLRSLLDRFKFNTYEHKHGTLSETIIQLQPDLVTPGIVEGYILITENGLIFKLKGAYETFSESRLKQMDLLIARLRDQSKDRKDIAEVATLLSQIYDASKKVETEKKIEKAIESAMSKFPRLQDLAGGGDDLEQTKKILVQVLSQEISESKDVEMAPKVALSNLPEKIASILTLNSSAVEERNHGEEDNRNAS